MDANQILVMDGGRILERGTHLELRARKDAYAEMWTLQQPEEESACLAGATPVSQRTTR